MEKFNLIVDVIFKLGVLVIIFYQNKINACQNNINKINQEQIQTLIDVLSKTKPA